MAEKKHSAFALLKILQEETDENHILTANEIIERLERQYQLTIERRTLYSNVEILRQAGYEVSDYRDNGKGYYLISRQFDKGEILLLCNAIHASNFINSKQSDELIGKLLETLSIDQQKEFRESVYLPNRLKSENKTLFYNISLISEAIREGKMIRFTYLKYNDKKKLVPRRSDPYTVEPRYIVYRDSRPYMISTSTHYTDFTHYRLDKIRDLIILETPARRLTKVRQTEAYQYAQNKLFMFSGETDMVSFKCEERLMDQMVDIFGPGMTTLPAEKGYFIARIRTTDDGAVFLAQQFMDAMEIIEPERLREAVKERLQEALTAYNR